MVEEFRFRSLKKTDCKEAAVMRFEAQEWGFLPSMGTSFLAELFKATCDSKWGFGIVCEDNKGRIAGFVYATTNLQNYYIDILLRRGTVLLFWAFLRLLRQPGLALGLLQYISYPGRVPYSHIKAEWLTMVIRREYRGKGIAKRITISLIDEYRRRGITQFKSTVPSNNRISCLIHDSFGFQLLGKFKLHGECINIYAYYL